MPYRSRTSRRRRNRKLLIFLPPVIVGVAATTFIAHQFLANAGADKDAMHPLEVTRIEPNYLIVEEHTASGTTLTQYCGIARDKADQIKSYPDLNKYKTETPASFNVPKSTLTLYNFEKGSLSIEDRDGNKPTVKYIKSPTLFSATCNATDTAIDNCERFMTQGWGAPNLPTDFLTSQCGDWITTAISYGVKLPDGTERKLTPDEVGTVANAKLLAAPRRQMAEGLTALSKRTVSPR